MSEERTTSLDDPEDEIILGESISDEVRRIRVYGANPDDDFVIEVPAKARVTFGYFNPASAGRVDMGYDDRRGAVTAMKTTALRIYEKGERGNQLACFTGVRGFRDYQVKKTKLVQKVVVQRRYSDDGEGSEDWSGNRQRELVVAREDDDVPF